MATIGSISVAFTASLKGLESGIEEAIDLFDDLSESAEDLTEKLSAVSSTNVRLKVDSSELEKAKDDIDKLQKSATDAQTSIKPSVDTSEVEAAKSSTEGLGEAIAETAAAATQGRGAIAQLVVSTARFSAAATIATNSYRSLRDGTLAYIAATTGARTAADRAAIIQAALRGEYTAMRVVLGGVGQAVQEYASNLFSVDGATAALQGGLRIVLSSLGMTDEALAASIQHFASFSISQASAAAVTRLSQRSMSLLSESLDSAGESFARFYAANDKARAIGSAVSGTFQSLLRAFESLNNSFNVGSARLGLFLGRFNVAGAVSAKAGDAFDAVRAAVAGLASGSTSLSQTLTSIGTSMASLVPSSTAAAAAISRVASTSATLIGAAGRIFDSLMFIRQAQDASAGGFMALAARMTATSAAIGAATGGITSWAAGTSVMAGAAAGATGAIATLSAAFPITASLAVAAAVATGRFSHELEKLSVQAQQVEQMADRFGAPRKEIERLRLAASNSGVGLSQLAKGQQAFYTSLSKIKVGQLNVDNVREAKLAFDRLGISMEEIKSRSPDQVFALVAEELSKVEDPAKRTQIAFDLFGKQGAAILPALKEFGELAADFDRLGGSISDLDFSRFTSLEQSFDRLKASTDSLGQTLLVPFTELQKAFNNVTAEIRGGLVAALAPIASLIADATKPFAVLIEVAGRIANILLRVVGVVSTLVAGFSRMTGIADIFTGIAQGVFAALAPIERFVGFLQTIASAATSRLGVVTTIFSAIGKVIGFVVGGLASLVTYTAIGAAAWGVYSVAVATATGFSLTAAAAFITMWAAALGPFVPIIAAFAAIGAGIAALGYGVMAAVDWFYDLAESAGLVGDSSPKINAATASVDELAEAAASAQQEYAATRGVITALASAIPGGKALADTIFGSSASAEEFKTAVEEARGGLGDLTIRAARFGQAGADAAKAAQEQFNVLQQALADGNIDLPTFEEESAKLRENLEENLKVLSDDSPEITLQKNLELFRSLDEAAKNASQSVREIGAGVQLGDKFFPASDEIKARAQSYKDEYVAALEAIKQKQQGGGFARELTQRREQNQADFDAGRISQEQFERVKLELDTTNAQEQAAIAAEDAKREFERNKAKIELDISFASDIRKQLEDAFLSPVQKMQKELDKIANNNSLTESEKDSARLMVERDARKELIGESAQAKLSDRTRDLSQARDAGIISPEQQAAGMRKAMDEFASAVGATKTPFEEFSGSLDNIAEQFGFVGQPLDVVREKLAGFPDQLALFDKAVKAARDNLLSSLGVQKSPEQVFQEQMAKIAEAANSTDPNKRISAEQRQQAEDAARRKRDESLGVPADMSAVFRERQNNINEAFGNDPARRAVAENALAIDQRKAAGLDATPAQALQAGVDKINAAFGVTGQSMDEIQKTLKPEEFAAYQEAIKKNSEAVKASLGVEQTGAQKLAESRTKLDKAVADGVVSQEEANKALKAQRDSLLSSLGISKTPAQDFEDAVARIKENAAELSPEELAKGLKEAKDRLLASLGVDKSPAQQTQESLEKLREAFKKGQISGEEFAKGAQKAKDSLLQSLGIPLDPVVQLGERLNDLQEAFDKGLISQEEFTRGQEEARRSMLPGGEAESPVKKFERDIEAVDRALSQGLIDDEDAAQRRLNLQAQLQEDLKPALGAVTPDRRNIESSDVRSRAGVDTFFRILRGQDNPSLKAQLETARNTRLLAEAMNNPDAAPVVAQLQAQ